MQMPYVSESLKSLHPQIIIIIKSKKKQADKQPKICGRTSIYHQFETYCLCKFLSGDLGTKIRRLHVHECAHWVQRINSNFLILLHCLMLFFFKKSKTNYCTVVLCKLEHTHILSSALVNFFLDGLNLLKGFLGCHTEHKQKSLCKKESLIEPFGKLNSSL